MTRTLLLCFIHGFKGTDDTFHNFPNDLKRAVKKRLSNDRVETVIYPKYETKGELAEATTAFLEWLKERVMEIRKEHSENPWPPSDRDVGVVLVAHSMGGFVAADSLLLALNDRKANEDQGGKSIFPPIQGILTFDTPYNGLARSMFVYGAFSNYGKVSTVFNVMTALSAAAPAGLARLGTRTAATASVPNSSRNPQWKAWQLVAVKTGTVGAIAAGGVAAYMNREAIMEGMRSVKNLNKESVVQSYRQSMDALGQGLAYINRGNVGKSFAWLSDHFTFVGALLKQNELSLRLQRMGNLKGIGIHDFYISLGENGYWSGGYFVPERTFCAVPEVDQPANHIFSRYVMPSVDDEMKAHLSMFKPEKNGGYDSMTEKSADLVEEWFLCEEEIVDDPSIQEANSEDQKAEAVATEMLEKEPEKIPEKYEEEMKEESKLDDQLPDESPIDIAAAASLVPLPDDDGALVADAEEADTPEKRHYLNHLFKVAQQAGSSVTDVKGWLPSMPSMPQMPSMPTPSMPSMPQIPASVSSLGQISMPGILSKKKSQEATLEKEKEQEKNDEETQKKGESETAEDSKGEQPKQGAQAE
ncbi:hypothetical protein B0T10DRAFT_442360 [Thelonectria olida]|uniref:DUF676 domain-containing protein n=1 Tax=Thelonectria olida TaxID=1576542 RepID=A0A9P8W2A3_9HYPO|nr:hypothetical protein B0T10DRAFT_442360 [Thelonectria olida]